MAVTNTAAAMAVTAVAAVTVATTVRFPLGQVARHRFLSPASSSRSRRGRAVPRFRCIVFREGQVQGQWEG